MIQAIFYKEWIKTRGIGCWQLFFMIGITGYSMLRIGRTIAIQGIDHLWVVMVQKDAIFIDLLQFVPLLIGILLAAVQFFPEMQRKCLKLTLHLPYSQKKMIMSMLAYGVLALVTCFAMSFYYDGSFICHNILQVSWCSVFLFICGSMVFCPDLPVICLFHGFAWNPHGSAGF